MGYQDYEAFISDTRWLHKGEYAKFRDRIVFDPDSNFDNIALVCLTSVILKIQNENGGTFSSNLIKTYFDHVYILLVKKGNDYFEEAMYKLQDAMMNENNLDDDSGQRA